MTELQETPSPATTLDTAASAALWRPFVDEPVLTPRMALGWDATDLADRERLTRYLSALVAARRAPVHLNVAFNAAYFGYDLTTGGYVGGPLRLEDFPGVRFGETTEALPVGAMVNIAAGEHPLYAEIAYKEGAHPELSPDGTVPAWLSGAPAGAVGPGVTDAGAGEVVLRERLVADVDAFGQDFSLTRPRLDRLRRRGRWLDADGHLLLDARYHSRSEADLDDTTLYARYLLTRARTQLLSMAAPMPLSTVLSDQAGEEQLAAALSGVLGTIADALASLPELRLWRGYAMTRASLAARLADPGPLGGDDLGSLAAGLARSAVPSARGRWAPDRAVTYTAIGPRLRTMHDSAAQLVGAGYATAVCHANVVISDYARRETDDTTGLLHGQVHLRLDDPWQGGGVWRGEHPTSRYTHVDPVEALGLGWQSTVDDLEPELALRPSPDETDTAPEPEEADEFDALVVSDSQLSWTHALRLTHLLEQRLALPDHVATQMRDSGLTGVSLRLLLSHDGYDLDPDEATQTVQTRLSGRPQLTGVDWPLEFFPGIVLTSTWGRGASVIRATTTLLDTAVTLDDIQIEHRYDPRILTRDAAPGQPARGATARRPAPATLTLPQRVLRAVRRLGLLDPDGRAVLLRTHLPRAVYGTADSASVAELDSAVAELIAAGALRTGTVTIDVHGRPCVTDLDGAPTAQTLVYEPRPLTGPPRAAASPHAAGALEQKYLRTHHVAGHLRWIKDRGQTATDKAKQAYRRDRERFGLGGAAELPEGYTYISPFNRNVS
ncbi:hypothetical protein [Amycolatopsis magusensis]|uniref:Uncharacterized protein n=1 Tax=Amycolatopsis magusensis TaxID=882444 RepID=A0ABS4PWN6_9PSEU|nr:hypothetical protein [Amycolatopsis magusensis]MBP2183841.1 hypothetical protein [Amycolatopsis magusensis]